MRSVIFSGEKLEQIVHCVCTPVLTVKLQFFRVLMRKYAEFSHFSRRVLKIGDDFFYGKRPRKKVFPRWAK